MPPNSTPPGEGMASRWEGCRLGALPRLLANHLPLPSSGSLPKIEADDGLIRAVEGGRVEQKSEKERYANRETALMFPIVFSKKRRSRFPPGKICLRCWD